MTRKTKWRRTILPVLLITAATVCSLSARAADPLTVDRAALDAAIKKGRFREVTSVLVAHDGRVVFEAYWGAGGPDVLNDTRSAMKSLTAMAVGAAIADGHIGGVGEPAMAFFESERPFRFESDAKDSITLRDLLTMSSALDCNDNERSSPGNEEHMYPARRWLFFVLDLPVRDDYRRNERGYGPFRYCTAGSFLLGQVIERAAGERVDRYIERRLLEPLGIERIHWDRSPSREVMTGGGAELTSRALLSLGELVRQRGQHGGKQVLPARWIDEMLTAHVNANSEQDYGYQWWRREFTCGVGTVDGWYMSGNGGNKVAVIDALDLTIVVTARLYGTRGMHEQSTALIEDFVLAAAAGCARGVAGTSN